MAKAHKFDLTKDGVRTRLGNKIIVLDFNTQTHECVCSNQAFTATYVISRSVIVDDDDTIIACCQKARMWRKVYSAEQLQGAMAHVIVRPPTARTSLLSDFSNNSPEYSTLMEAVRTAST